MMSAPDTGRFLDLKFNYYDDDDTRLLDESLHRELSRLQPFIKGFCESLYGWEILETDERLDTESRLYSSIWIPLEGLASRFRRRNERELFRYFELEVAVVDEDTITLTVFENMTEFSNFAPFRYQQVAEAEMDARKLGLRARDHYRPPTERTEATQPTG